jgi:hydrogenase maturation protein HypF
MSVVTARRVVVEGVVQGVGFRPFVYGLAVRHRLAGWVRNTAGGVEAEVEGPEDALGAFVDGLVDQVPPLARVDRVHVEPVAPRGYAGFSIEASGAGDGIQPVPADIGTCAACLREVMDPADRRFGYPFTNCTQCGPRFTIIRALPYDRPSTTMAGFAMCPRCRGEYEDPADRRFHAQPNACPACGPRLALLDPLGLPTATPPLPAAARLLAEGSILAIKGIGGFHLACDAANAAAVARLRARKGREAKPLALMVPDLAAAEQLCEVSSAERALLTAPGRPIVLLRARRGAPVAPAVAPDLDTLGIMLPYAPLQHLLFAAPPCPPALVMTSGNASDEPIAIDDLEARQRLGGIADAFLLHDRPIEARCDDSVTRIAAGGELPLRRSRGYAPLPVALPIAARPVLACGAELKVTICVTRGRYAFLSPHIGDLEHYETYVAYREMVARMLDLFRVRPQAVAHDLHPGYLSTRFALEQDPGLPRIGVQHHHAHVAACMAEHGLTGPVLGVAFDGTGYGPDGHVWGGEFLIADYAGFRRAAHLAYVPMPGGDRAVREPFRMALAHLWHAGIAWDADLPPVRELAPADLRVLARQVETGVNAPLTSSMGRLFDAVSSLVGLRQRAGYEAQAAIELEARVDRSAPGAYPVVLQRREPLVIDPVPIIRGVVEDRRAGVPIPVIAARFHRTAVKLIGEVCEQLHAMTGLRRIVLSGGVFQNVILVEAVLATLADAGFEVFTHRTVPPNDGGLALGQAMVANAVVSDGA